MKIVFLANNWLGLKVLEYLREGDDEFVALGIHPSDRRKFGDEIVELGGVDRSMLFEGSEINAPETIEKISSADPDICLSVMFGTILKPPFLALFGKQAYNLHPSLLPYNRGSYPNVWSIVDGTPAGATLHRIDAGIDTGEIIAQREIPVEPVDTGETLYRKLEETGLSLFRDIWPDLRSGPVGGMRQAVDGGTEHRLADVDEIDEIKLDDDYTARTLIDRMRARTFDGHRGTYFEVDGRRVYIRIQLEYENE